MCLRIDTHIHKKNGKIKSLVAEQDILVYKVLISDGKHFCTPIRHYPIKFDNKGTYFYDVKKFGYCGSIKENNLEVSRGIHSYSTIFDAYHASRFKMHKVHYAIIPKGSRFFINIESFTNEIASNNLVVFSDSECYHDYHMKLGITPIELYEYSLKYLYK